MTQTTIGMIERVDIKSVWPREADDFTPWLADNLGVLGAELGMELELDGTEVPVGNFKLDLLARDANSKAVVAIENQIAGTDHTHLGQLLTYAAGMDAGIVIWIATEFRDEHRAALDWLNEGTRESLDFFGVEVQAVRIGESLPAPLFRRAVVPNSWSKDIKTTPADLSDTQKKYVRYWKPLLEELKNTQGWRIKTQNPLSYFDAGSGLGRGFGRFGRTMRFTSGGEVRVELQFLGPDKDWNKAAFDLLQQSREHIEAQLGPLNWDRLDHANVSRVGVLRSGSIDDSEEALNDFRTWMVDHVRRFPTTFRPYLEDVLRRME